MVAVLTIKILCFYNLYEIPYQVNKAEMIRKTAEMVNDKKLEGISSIRDESDRNGMRIVYVLKKDAIPNN